MHKFYCQDTVLWQQTDVPQLPVDRIVQGVNMFFHCQIFIKESTFFKHTVDEVITHGKERTISNGITVLQTEGTVQYHIIYSIYYRTNILILSMFELVLN